MFLTVRVVPRASNPGVAGLRDGAVLIRLSAAPVEGAANAELVGLLSDLLGIPKRAITIVSGDKSRLKRLRIEGIEEAQVMARLLKG